MPFTKNIVTDYGAVADGAWASATLSITAGTNTLHSATSIWGSGDVLKTIVVGEAGGPGPQGGAPLITTITGYNSSTGDITLAANAGNTLTALANTIVAWGTNNGKTMVPDGIDGPFESFRLANAGDSGTLTIPNTGTGVYLVASGNFQGMFRGIRNITVNATGATLAGGTFQLGSAGQLEPSGHTARTASVTAGALSVTLLTTAETSRFSVGQWVLMTGFSLQYAGYPSNHQRYEYLQVATINAGTGVITFNTPLVNSYLSTWPVYLATGLDYAGPATLYSFDPDFDFVGVLNGLTIAHHAQQGVAGRDITWNNVVAYGIYGPYPTQNNSVVFNNCTAANGNMEVDKYIGSFTMTGCTWSGINFQSACPTTFVFDSSVCTFTILGGAYNTTIRNSSSIGTLSPGPGYGFSNSFTVSDSVVSNFGGVTAHESGTVHSTNGLGGSMEAFTMAGGIITIPSSYYPNGYVEKWPVTGARMFFQDPNVGCIGSFTITDVTQDASNVYVHTDWTKNSGGYPARTYSSGLYFIMHPAPVCTFTNVTSCPEVADLSNPGAAGLRLYSYSKRTITAVSQTGRYWQMWGRFKYIKVTVTTPYAGGAYGGPVTVTIGNTNNNGIKASDGTATTAFLPIIDLRAAGIRIFDATANNYSSPVTWTSTASGASDTLPSQTEALYCGGNYILNMTDITSVPRPIEYTVEFITDQGFADDLGQILGSILLAQICM